MPIRRLASAALIAAFLAVLVATATAQYQHLPKKILKGAQDGKTQPAAPEPVVARPSFQCSQLDEAMLDKFLKAQALKKKVYDDEIAKANANKAKADALAAKRANVTINTTMKTEECKDAFKEKDPRMKEARRLEDLVAGANDRGDEAKAAELSKKLDPLNEAVELDADRACGGKGSAALHDCMEKKTAELKKQGVTPPMLQIQAQGACMSDPTTSGIAGASAASPEEDAANAAYSKGMAEARNKADQAEKDATGMDEHQRALFVECVLAVLNRDNEMSSQMPTAVRVAIEKHEAELNGSLK